MRQNSCTWGLLYCTQNQLAAVVTSSLEFWMSVCAFKNNMAECLINIYVQVTHVVAVQYAVGFTGHCLSEDLAFMMNGKSQLGGANVVMADKTRTRKHQQIHSKHARQNISLPYPFTALAAKGT